MTLLRSRLALALGALTLAITGICTSQAKADYIATTTTTTYTASPDMERYEAVPGRFENQWVAPVYGTSYDASGRPFTYIAQPGYSRQVWVEPVYAYRQRSVTQVVYVSQPVYCPPPQVVYAPPPPVCQPVVVCTPPPPPRPAVSISLGFGFGSSYCPPPRPVYCPPPRPVYCPPAPCFEPRRDYGRSGTSVSVDVRVRSRR